MLILSLFPGIGLLDTAFEEQGFCVVRGPDVIWGGDVRRFHPPADRFDGIIGGPPCQLFSALRRINPAAGKHGNLIPEFERCVAEARPVWFLMENVAAAPEPVVEGYGVTSLLLNNRWVGGEQNRERRFSFGVRGGRLVNLARYVELEALEPAAWSPTVTRNAALVPVKIGGNGKTKRSYTEAGARRGPSAGPRMTLGEACRLQGLPAEFFAESPLSVEGARKALGNAVPLHLGRAIAKAVKSAVEGL